MHRLTFASLIAPLLLTGCSQEPRPAVVYAPPPPAPTTAPVVYTASPAPPPGYVYGPAPVPIVEAVPPPPVVGAVWVGGFWEPRPHGWFWVRGHWR